MKLGTFARFVARAAIFLKDYFRESGLSHVPAEQLRQPIAGEFTLLHVVDGDTFDGRLELGLGLSLTDRFRCADYDAWESTKRRSSVEVTDEEVGRGKAATEAVKGLLSSPDVTLHAEAVGRDNYGRVLAVFTVQATLLGESMLLADWMREKGHTRG